MRVYSDLEINLLFQEDRFQSLNSLARELVEGSYHGKDQVQTM